MMPARTSEHAILRRGLSILVLLAVAASAPIAAAQTRSEELGEMSDEELQADEWEFLDEGQSTGSLVGGLLALTFGSVAHGVGHFYTGDTRTFRILMIAEAVSVVMIAGSVLVESLTHSDGDLAPLYEPLMPLGASVFVTTWLLDIIGTFKENALTFTEVRRPGTQLGLAVSYEYSSLRNLPLQHALFARLELDLWPFYLYPHGTIGLDDDFRHYGGVTGLRIGIGRRPRSFVYLQGEASRYLFDTLGFSYWSILATLGLSFDFGEIFPHLDGLIFKNELGAGTQRHIFDFDPDAPVTATNFLVVKTSLAVNPLGGFFAEFGYLERPDTLVGNISQSIGSFFATLSYALTDRLTLFVDGRLGNGFQTCSGAQYTFVR